MTKQIKVKGFYWCEKDGRIIHKLLYDIDLMFPKQYKKLDFKKIVSIEVLK